MAPAALTPSAQTVPCRPDRAAVRRQVRGSGWARLHRAPVLLAVAAQVCRQGLCPSAVICRERSDLTHARGPHVALVSSEKTPVWHVVSRHWGLWPGCSRPPTRAWELQPLCEGVCTLPRGTEPSCTRPAGAGRPFLLKTRGKAPSTSQEQSL